MEHPTSAESSLATAIFLILVGLIVLSYYFLKTVKNKNISEYNICTNCGSRNIEKIAKGSCLMEIVLFLLLFIPWIIYVIWRQTNVTLRCKNCKSYNIIPIDSPKGRRLLKELNIEDEVY